MQGLGLLAGTRPRPASGRARLHAGVANKLGLISRWKKCLVPIGRTQLGPFICRRFSRMIQRSPSGSCRSYGNECSAVAR